MIINDKKELNTLVDDANRFYDQCKLIRGELTEQVVMGSDGSYHEEAFLRYETVIRGVHKENLISLSKLQNKEKLLRFEFIDKCTCSILSHYISFEEEHYILECVSILSDDVLSDIVRSDNFVEKVVEYNKKVYNDALTGVFNRYYFDEKMKDNSNIYAIAMIDVNNFKNVNDTYGHDAGDEALKAIAECLSRGIRNTDALIRYGGDEFVILYPKIPADVLERRLVALCENVSKIVLPTYHTIHLSISIGAVYDVKNLNEDLKTADHLMYKSKRLKLDVSMEQSGTNVVDIEQPISYKRTELNCSGLTDRIFDAFSNSAENQYLYLTNMKTGVTRWSKAAVERFGLPGEYFLNARDVWCECLHPDNRAAYLADIDAMFRGKKDRHHLEYRVKDVSGNYIVCTCDGVLLKGNYGEADLFAGMVYSHGIIDNVDPVTSLYNEYEFLQILTQLYQDDVSSLILVIGINNFSNLNMIYDYSQGNKILKEFASKINELMSCKGMVYRLDGAKLGIQIRDGDSQRAEEIYREIQKIAATNVFVDNMHIALSISGGALVLSNYKGGARSILSAAVYAQQISKRSRFGSLVFYDSDLGDASISSMNIFQLAKNDVNNGCRGFYIEYQPVIAADTLRITGVEALLRWKNEMLGVVPPSKFIPMIENDTCMKTLGEFVLRKALTETKPIIDKYPDFMVGVNVAYTQLDDNGGFRETVIDTLKEIGFNEKNLCLELTERCQWIGIERLNELISFFRGRGISVAIDDFGTGYSSISLLKNLDVDEIKIDKSFTQEIITDKKTNALVMMMIEVANKLNVKTCIEGIENQIYLDYLSSASPQYYQGYFFSRAISLEKIIEIVEDSYAKD